MKTKKSFTFNKLYLFAFLIPAVIMLVIISATVKSIPLATVLSCILICTISIFLFWWNSIIN